MHVHTQAIFAAGQLYVLSSRVTDDRNLELIGLPPFDLLEDVARAWREAGYNVDEKFKQAVTVTGEWTYEPGVGPISDRVKQKRETVFQMKRRTLADCLNPQPVCARPAPQHPTPPHRTLPHPRTKQPHPTHGLCSCHPQTSRLDITG